jgi:hypothetical protein
VLSLFGSLAAVEALSPATEHPMLSRRTEQEEHGDGDERRHAPRLTLPPGVAGTTATGHLVELLNISPRGLLLRSTHPVREGERHVLRVPDATGWVTFEVNVVHAERADDSWGGFVLAGVERTN